jgi:hypothetical protein
MILKSQPDSQEFMTNQRTVIMFAPILPGKAEAWRRFMQEMLGSRRQEYEASRRRLGIQTERAWISETRQETIGIIIIETDHLEQALIALATSNHPFDCWFREQLLALQGLDLTRPDPVLLPNLAFVWQSDEG